MKGADIKPKKLNGSPITHYIMCMEPPLQLYHFNVLLYLQAADH